MYKKKITGIWFWAILRDVKALVYVIHLSLPLTFFFNSADYPTLSLVEGKIVWLYFFQRRLTCLMEQFFDIS